jgi:hypothetical protein
MAFKNHPRHHPNDMKPPKGVQYVRIDGYDTVTPLGQRVYVSVTTGHGEKERAQRARGFPNYRKILLKHKKKKNLRGLNVTKIMRNIFRRPA